jgi:hypothetical protein
METGEALPIGMGVNFGGIANINHLGWCDKLEVVDENGDLAEALGELIENARFRIYSGSGYSPEGDFYLEMGEKGSVLATVPSAHLRYEKASRRVLVTATYLALLDSSVRHCAAICGQLVGLTNAVTHDVLATMGRALDCCSMVKTELLAGDNATWGRNINANYTSGTSDLVASGIATDVNGMATIQAGTFDPAINTTNAYYTASQGGVYVPLTELGKKGMTRGSLAAWYALYPTGSDATHWLLSDPPSSDPGTAPAGYAGVAWNHVTDDAPNFTGMGDLRVTDNSSGLSTCRVGNVLDTVRLGATAEYPSMYKHSPSECFEITGIIEMAGIAPLNPKLLQSFDDDTMILSAYMRVKLGFRY